MEAKTKLFAVTFEETVTRGHTLVVECSSRAEALGIGRLIEGEGLEKAEDIAEAAQVFGYLPVSFNEKNYEWPSEIGFTGEVEEVVDERAERARKPVPADEEE